MVRIVLWVIAIVFVGMDISAAEMGRDETEAFLKRAKVIDVKDMGSGATKPLKITLAREGVEMKATFKSVDVRMDSPTQFGGKTAAEYADSYKHELAAYELDKLLGLDLLPVIIEREIQGKKGSLRVWVEDVMPRYGHGNLPPDANLARDQIQMVWLFDYLIYNVDRRTHNLMIGSDWKPVLIDHSLAFTLFESPVRPIYRFPVETIDALRRLSDSEIEKRMKPFLRSVQIDAFLKRRLRVLEMVDRRVAQSTRENVFLSLADIC
jgi:hypothetical protein